MTRGQHWLHCRRVSRAGQRSTRLLRSSPTAYPNNIYLADANNDDDGDAIENI